MDPMTISMTRSQDSEISQDTPHAGEMLIVKILVQRQTISVSSTCATPGGGRVNSSDPVNATLNVLI